MTPCLCGHAFHFGRPCDTEKCTCTRSAPDYVAGERDTIEAIAEGPVRDRYLGKLVKETQRMARVLRYNGPGSLQITCAYCTGVFVAFRAHATTCCGACRQALSVAVRYTSEDEIPSAWERRDTWSEERAEATGTGTVTAAEGYAHDLRVWQDVQRRRVVVVSYEGV